MKDGKQVDASVGDLIVVPPRAPHTFSNPFNEEAKFFNTFTPSFYIHYFKLMKEWEDEGRSIDPEMLRKAMLYYATIGVEGTL